MDNKIVIEYANGGYSWIVATHDSVTLCQGYCRSRQEAFAAAMFWMEAHR